MKIRVLIITSIGGKGIGGPRTYVENLPKALGAAGVDSRVVRLASAPRPFPKIFYVLTIVFYASRYKIFYSLSGSPLRNLPLYICAKMLGRKFFIRPGGDFLWERAVESGKTEKTPSKYYADGDYKDASLSLALFSFSIRHADKIIFPTHYLKNLYETYFSVKPSQAEVVGYPFPAISGDILNTPSSRGKQFIFAGRLVQFKNLTRLIEAFAAIDKREGATLKLVGGGPAKSELSNLIRKLHAGSFIFLQDRMPQEALLREIRKSYCTIVPSIFEPGSFFMLESLKLRTPVIFTKESGLYETYKDELIFIDPYSISDIKEKIEWLIQENNYNIYMRKIEAINTERSWDDVARDHKVIFESL